ncbi:hypothetical protein KILIM_057_00310 [Kineosphaera limosa NBRC 100340]|uniref:Copper resistance protein D domain-containing protein n=1 Tax=Kineosphaera limosa NBRC 100340 TaxID=1184609 RepID=K6WCY3_9MICO|nr:hypothetical protein KILIM_057_00310 [Kineosphaera limosa NBRC 100340]
MSTPAVGVPVAVAVLVVILAGSFTGAFAGLVGFEDGGPLVRWGIPLTRAVHDLAAAGTLGLLLVAGTIVPERASTDRRGTARRIAVVTGSVWTLTATIGLLLSVSNISGIALGDPAYLGQLSQVWAIEYFRVLLIDAVLAAVVTLGAATVRTRGGSTWLAAITLVALAILALVGHAAGAAAHDTAVNSLAVHLIGSLTWVGTLAAILLLWSRLGDALAITVARCSTIFLWCFVAVALSGVVNAAVRVGSLDGLTSRYGMLVLAKVALLVLLALAGWRMRSGIVARLRAAGGTSEGTRGAFAALAIVELGLMGAAVGLGVALSRSAPPLPSQIAADATVALTGYPAPAAPPQGWAWLTTVRIDPLMLAVGLLAIGLYVAAVVRLHRRGDAWSPLRTTCWVLGWLIFLWATNGAPGVYGRLMFSAHMLMHMSIAMLVPVLLVLAAPLTLAARALPARRDKTLGPRELLLATAHSRWMTFWANPVVASINFAGSLYLFYFTSLFELALRTHVGMIVMTVHFLLAGYVFCWCLVGADPGPRRWPPSLRLVLLFVTMSFHAFFGVALLSTARPLAADYFTALDLPWHVDLLADQVAGGALTWGFGEIPMLLLAISVAVVWMRSDEQEARRRDRQADRDDDAELAAYNAELARLGEYYRRRGE